MLDEAGALVSVPDSRAGVGVGLGVAPLVEGNTSIGRLVDTRDLDSRAGLSSTGGLDLKLEALDVELCLADVALVETNVLNADEVFTCRDVLLYCPLEAILLPVGPGGVDTGGGGVVEAALHHLDPIAGTIVVLNRARSLGDVDKARAGVLNKLVEEELEAELVASLDSVGGSVAGDSALVATEIIAVNDFRRERWVVGVAVLARVGIVTSDSLAVDDEAVEDVVGVGTKGRNESEEGSDLHVVDGGGEVLDGFKEANEYWKRT